MDVFDDTGHNWRHDLSGLLCSKGLGNQWCYCCSPIGGKFGEPCSATIFIEPVSYDIQLLILASGRFGLSAFRLLGHFVFISKLVFYNTQELVMVGRLVFRCFRLRQDDDKANKKIN